MLLQPETTAPDFELNVTADQEFKLSDPERQVRNTGFLPRRLEPGLRQPDGAVQLRNIRPKW